MVQGMQIAAF